MSTVTRCSNKLDPGFRTPGFQAKGRLLQRPPPLDSCAAVHLMKFLSDIKDLEAHRNSSRHACHPSLPA